MEVLCPFCNQPLVQDEPGRPLYRCNNSDCECEDGGMSLYNNPRPLKWIEWKRRKLERERSEG